LLNNREGKGGKTPKGGNHRIGKNPIDVVKTFGGPGIAGQWGRSKKGAKSVLGRKTGWNGGGQKKKNFTKTPRNPVGVKKKKRKIQKVGGVEGNQICKVFKKRIPHYSVGKNVLT